MEVAPPFRFSGSSVLLQSYLRHRSSSGLHHAELLECFLGAHSVLDGPPHQILLLHLLQSLAEHLLFGSARYHAYPIKVAKDDVSGHHPHPTDLQRYPEVYDLPARRLILGVSSVGEGGKTKLEDPARVAMAFEELSSAELICEGPTCKAPTYKVPIYKVRWLLTSNWLTR